MGDRALQIFATVAAASSLAFGSFSLYTRVTCARETGAMRNAVVERDTALATCASARTAAEANLADASAIVQASQTELTSLRAEHESTEERLAQFRKLTAKFQKMIDSGKLEIVLIHGRMVVKLPASVLFASGKSDLSKNGETAVGDVAKVLKTVSGRRFMVAGHTDNVRIGSDSPYKNNLELSTARALTVAQKLIGAGMNPAHLVAAGYGEHEPVATNWSEPGRAKNRRIEIVLMPQVTAVPEIDAGAPKHGASHKTARKSPPKKSKK